VLSRSWLNSNFDGRETNPTNPASYHVGRQRHEKFE
jgi:hypothetical protein